MQVYKIKILKRKILLVINNKLIIIILYLYVYNYKLK